MLFQKQKPKQKLNCDKAHKFWSFKEISAGAVVLIMLTVFVTKGVDALWGSVQDNTPSVLHIDRSKDFSGWEFIGEQNDLVLQEGIMFLKPDSYNTSTNERIIRDPQGYIQSPKIMSENSFVCYKFIPRTPEIDFTIRSKNNFLITIGDGDDRSIRLKQFSNENNNWDTVRPDEIHINNTDDQGRFTLGRSIPLNRETTICLTVSAHGGEATKEIKTELTISQEGRPIILTARPSWTLVSNSQINGQTQYGAGLIDSRNAHPVVEPRGYCAVDMDLDRDKPTKEQRDACENP